MTETTMKRMVAKARRLLRAEGFTPEKYGVDAAWLVLSECDEPEVAEFFHEMCMNDEAETAFAARWNRWRTAEARRRPALSRR